MSGEGEVKSRDVGNVEVGAAANLADWGCGNSEGGFDVGGVGVIIFVAVDALRHLVLVGGWCFGGVRRTLVVGIW